MTGATVFPIRLYVVVAALIALVAFAVGQTTPGMGVMVAAAASTAWTAYSAHRQRK